MLAKTDMDGVSPLGMAARSGSKDVLEHVLSVIRQELSENEVRCHLGPRKGHTTQQTTTIGGFTQNMIQSLKSSNLTNHKKATTLAGEH